VRNSGIGYWVLGIGGWMEEEGLVVRDQWSVVSGQNCGMNRMDGRDRGSVFSGQWSVVRFGDD